MYFSSQNAKLFALCNKKGAATVPRPRRPRANTPTSEGEAKFGYTYSMLQVPPVDGQKAAAIPLFAPESAKTFASPVALRFSATVPAQTQAARLLARTTAEPARHRAGYCCFVVARAVEAVAPNARLVGRGILIGN